MAATPWGSFKPWRSSSIVFSALALLMLSHVSEVAARGAQYSLNNYLNKHVLTGRKLMAEAAPVVDVTDYGAKADPLTDNAQAFMKAWKAACNYAGGPSKMVIPSGTYITSQTVFQGPCKAKPVKIEVHGTLQAVSDPSLYPDGDWISVEDVEDVIFKGGILDGQGQKMWPYNDCKKNPKCVHLTVSLHFSKVKNGLVDGVTSVNSMGFHTSFTFSSNITVVKLNILAPQNSPNTDGIHISTTATISISDSVIKTGDDCLGIIQGTSNVSITNVRCGPGHGISIGSLGKYSDEKDVVGVHVKNCTLTGTTNGVRIKSFPSDISIKASDIIFEDISMDNVSNPIIIDQKYGLRRSSKDSSVKISDVHFKNIRGTSASATAVSLTCSKKFPCKGIQIEDVNLSYVGTRDVPYGGSCINVQPTFAGKQNPPNACAAGSPQD
ncbi:hypothetical protein SAY86_019965 [Trapa natans]|uniref:Exopolygalacturonase-like n=1 Tax=Trapa natans TaxID=22666 RepID=A0AAN7M240_TRANT|nr:hypothetical protein SAY86_019965 [Trapa natans]